MLKSDKDSTAEEVEAELQQTSRLDMNKASNRISCLITNRVEVGNLVIIN
jgi:hypothetical protein